MLIRHKLRFALPILVVGLTIILTVWGDAYRQGIIDRVVAKYGHLEEPMPENVAFGRFVGYAINAPAYVAAMAMPFIFNVRHWHFMQGDRDWWYLIFAVCMWYAIGRSLDGMRMQNSNPARSHGLAATLVRILGVAYGVFMCYRAVQLYDPPYNYARWFEIAVFCWGVWILVWSCRSLIYE